MRQGLLRGVVILAFVARAAHADLAGDLATDDPKALAAAVHAVEIDRADPDTLYAAGRAAEDKLIDPARALALYERLLREAPDARAAAAAERRAMILRAELGPGDAYRAQAAAFAKLVAEADRTSDVVARAEALAAQDWPGAPATMLWLAEWQRRHGAFAQAEFHYEFVVGRWPASREAAIARVGAAGAAIDAHQWDRAEALVARLPHATETDEMTRVELTRAIRNGTWRERFVVIAWVALAAVFLGLVASLAHAARKARRLSLRPPIEVIYGAPVAAVLVAASFTAHRAIGPAVTWISGVGLALAWLSGAALELAGGRLRSVVHVVACVVGVACAGYLALTHDGLIDLLVETVRFGPDV
ncbi:MAG: hypothetical protein JO257_17715 [Deltaproteobacteria bacterium]|nr:hypothetical protein [Deltaproteobacteria bacterium]